MKCSHKAMVGGKLISLEVSKRGPDRVESRVKRGFPKAFADRSYTLSRKESQPYGSKSLIETRQDEAAS